MLRALRYIAALLVLAFGLWIFGTSSSFKTCKAEQTAASAEQRQENPPSFALSIADDTAISVRCVGHVLYEYREFSTAVATVFIAIFTFTLWQSTKRMMRATQSAVDLARQEFIATHRPRVIVRFIQGPFQEDGRRLIFITFANVGDSEAIIKAIGADLAIWRVDAEGGSWESPGLEATPVDLDPVISLKSGQRHTVRVTGRGTWGDTQTFAERSDQILTITQGAIEYRDGNGISRETGFSRTFDRRSRTFRASENPEEEYQD